MKKADDDGIVLHTVERELTATEVYELRQKVATMTLDLADLARRVDDAKRAKQLVVDELAETAAYRAVSAEKKRFEGELLRTSRAISEERIAEQVECQWEVRGQTECLVRLDNGEVVERRPASVVDRQTELPGLGGVDQAVRGLRDTLERTGTTMTVEGGGKSVTIGKGHH